MANFTGNGTKSLHTSLKASLKKLNTDYIDLLYVHWWDFSASVRCTSRAPCPSEPFVGEQFFCCVECQRSRLMPCSSRFQLLALVCTSGKANK